MNMKTNTNNIMLNARKWIRMFIILIIAAIGFSYLYRHGISPVWAAVAITLFPGFFRFIYKTVCFLVTVGIVIAILNLFNT